MAYVTADRVRDTTTTTGTGALTVSGTPASGFRTFSSVMSVSDTFYYAVQHQSANEWEVGLGTYSASNEITRTTVYSSSNAGSAVTFSAGTKDVFITLAATKTVQVDGSGSPVNLGTVPVASGGSGVATLTGILKGNGTSAFTAVTAPSGALVGTTDTQTLSGKTIEAGTFTNGYTEEVYVANTSTAITLNLDNGSFQVLTLTGSATITMPTATAGKSFIILLKQDATGSRTVTWTTVKWPSGVAPTITATASKLDIFSFFADGASWYGVTGGQNYTP